jgi:hypothetical protein
VHDRTDEGEHAAVIDPATMAHFVAGQSALTPQEEPVTP